MVRMGRGQSKGVPLIEAVPLIEEESKIFSLFFIVIPK